VFQICEHLFLGSCGCPFPGRRVAASIKPSIKPTLLLVIALAATTSSQAAEVTRTEAGSSPRSELNFRTNPLMLASGSWNFDLDRKLSPRLTLGPSLSQFKKTRSSSVTFGN
jgi:hypothetical protein